MRKVTKAAWDKFTESQVTPESIYRERRKFLGQLGFMGAGSLLSSHSFANSLFGGDDEVATAIQRVALNAKQIPAYHDDGLTPESKAITHNNFYEFGSAKDQPAKLSRAFKVDPWQLVVDGEVAKPQNIDVSQLINSSELEQRIYRLRCVEAWSMVIPWVGIPLSSLLRSLEFKSTANYLSFETLYDPEQMPGQKTRRLGGGIDYPYREGLTMAEAMHPLTFIAVGMYGKTLPAQNGAPLRLVVPWKYGFKSIKSIVRISATERQPMTTWNSLASREYGFYANVNPNVDHPRWSQASERRIDDSGLLGRKRIDTELFNGYAGQVASLYQGLDLKRNY